VDTNHTESGVACGADAQKTALGDVHWTNLKNFLIKGVVGSFSLKIGGSALGLANSVLLARMLGPDQYGILAHTFSLIALWGIPIVLGLQDYLPREVAKYKVQKEWGLLKGLLKRASQSVFTTSLVAILICFAVTWGFWDESPRIGILWLASPLLCLHAFNKVRQAVLRGFRNVVLAQIPEHFIRPGLLFATLLCLWKLDATFLNVKHAVGLEITATAFAFVFGSIFLIRIVPTPMKKARPAYCSRLWLRQTMPFMFLGSVFFLNSQLDIIVLGIFRPTAEIGAYKVAIQAVQIVVFILYAVNMVTAPIITELYHQKEMRRLQRVITASTRTVMAVSIPIILTLMFFGDRLIEFGFGKQYIAAATPLAILCSGQLFNSGCGSVGMILNMTNNERDSLTGAGLAALLNVTLNLILIPHYGLTGAGIATATSMVFWNVLLSYYVYKRLGIKSHCL